MSIRSDIKPRSRKALVPIAIIHKSAIVRAGLTQILQLGGFRVVAGGSRLEDIPEKIFRYETNQLILMGLGDYGPALLTQIRALKGRYDSARVVVIGENLHARELVPILEAGVNCILLGNDMCSETLIKSLELVLLGEVVFPLSLVNGLKDWLQPLNGSLALTPAAGSIPVSRAGDYCPSTTQNDTKFHLSAREKAILRHLMQGASNKMISRELEVAEATIKVHVRAVLRKIRASNRTQAAMWAHKYLSLGPESGHTLSRDCPGQRKFTVGADPNACCGFAAHNVSARADGQARSAALATRQHERQASRLFRRVGSRRSGSPRCNQVDLSRNARDGFQCFVMSEWPGNGIVNAVVNVSIEIGQPDHEKVLRTRGRILRSDLDYRQHTRVPRPIDADNPHWKIAPPFASEAFLSPHGFMIR